MARRAGTDWPSAGMPLVVAPMLAALGEPPESDDVAWEMKLDEPAWVPRFPQVVEPELAVLSGVLAAWTVGFVCGRLECV